MASVYNYIEPTGVIVPDTEEIQNNVIDEYKNVFGQDLITSPDTPQGALIVAEVLARDSVATNNATLANQINPNLAGGIYLDAIMALTGTSRTPETFTTVTATLTGVAGTVIPAGSQAQESSTDEIFQLINTVTLTGSGSAVGEFQAVNPGPIGVPANTLTQIVSTVLGWETVTNPDAGVQGATTQSDQEARAFRINTLALQGLALPEAITSALLATEGVKSLTFRENIANTPQVIDGITMDPHSIYVCVDGGADTDIANVLIAKKSAGCAFSNGAGTPVSETVTVPFSGQEIDVLFDRPELLPVLVEVTIVVTNNVLSDPKAAVKDAILKYVNGELEGEQGLTIGQDVSCFELAGAVNRVYPSIFVTLVRTSLAPPDPIVYSTDTIEIELWQKATINASSITVLP